MQIGLLASKAALADFFVSALAVAGHTVRLYPSREDLFSVLFADASLPRRAPHEVLLVELVLDDDGKQAIAALCRLVRDRRLPLIVLTTSGQQAIAQTQTAFPELCIKQLPLRLRTLLSLIEAQEPAMLSAGQELSLAQDSQRR
jgi:hypothetical protein